MKNVPSRSRIRKVDHGDNRSAILVRDAKLRGEDLARYWAAIYFSLGTPIPYGDISIGDRPWSPVVIEQDDGGNKIAASSDAGWASRRIEVIDLVRTREENEWDRYGRSR